MSKVLLTAIIYVMNTNSLFFDRGRWRALVNAVMNISGCIKCGEILDKLRTD
jgi:hypothetical protein